MADDNVCFICDGSGMYAAKPCQFCAGSGISTKLRSFDSFPVLLIIATMLFALAGWALHKAFFG